MTRLQKTSTVIMSDNRRRRGGLMRLFIGALVLASVAISLYAFVHSGLFTLKKVLIYGNRHLGHVEVVELMNLRGGENLLTLSMEDVYEKLHSSAWVRTVSMRKQLPDTLIVRLKESSPVALLQSGNGLFVLDSEGLLLERVSEASEYFLPMIVYESADGSSELMEAVRLAVTINEMRDQHNVKRVEIAGLEHGVRNMVARFDGMDIRVGEGDYRKKLERYFELSGEIGRRKINVDYIDLRFANRVVVKPMEEVVQ